MKNSHFKIPITSLICTLCIIFALHSYRSKILSFPFSKVLKCEGIVLNSNVSYHITDKKSLDELREIRDNNIQINDNDILLHYQDRDMEKITPSYWGTLFHEDEWKFSLDNSFTSKPNTKGNFQLPFMRYEKKQKGRFVFVSAGSVLSESDVTKKLVFNTHFVNKSNRYYFQILELNRKKVLSWYDDGIKQSYLLNKNKSDTIYLLFDTKSDKVFAKKQFNYFFNNTTGRNAEYELICLPNGPIKVINLQTGYAQEIKKKYFQVNDMMFSVKSYYSLVDRLLMTCYIFIILFSIIFLIYLYQKENKRDGNPMRKSLINLRLCILCFLSLGFPVLISVFDYQSFGFFRKFLISIVVPSILVLSLFYDRGVLIVYQYLMKFLPQNLKNGISDLLNKSKEISKRPIVLIIILLLGVLPILKASNERVLGIPTMHYIKTILVVIFAIIYSSRFKNVFGIINKILPSWLKPFELSIILLLFALIVTVLTKDFGTLLFIVLTVMAFDVIYKRFPIKTGRFKLKFWHIPSFYLLLGLSIFVISSQLNLDRKFYRVTYTFTNPSHHYYKNADEGDRQSISFLYQNLNVLKEYPLGIKNLKIPEKSKSVSHTDFAIHWSLMNNGVVFLILLLLVFAQFAFYSLSIAKTLILKTEDGVSLVTSSDYIRAFLSFVIIMFIVQCGVPLASNLLLPGAFLSGVPFLGISVSLGDALIILMLLILLDKSEQKFNNKIDYVVKETFVNHINTYSLRTTLMLMFIIITWIGIKIVVLYYYSNDESLWEITKDKVNGNYNLIPNTNDKSVLIKFSDSIFENKNLEKLSSNDRLIGKLINLKYYRGNDAKFTWNENNRFSLTKQQQLDNINVDSIFSTKKIKISGEDWTDESVYRERKYVNGRIQWSNTSRYYDNLNPYNDFLNRDLSATINKEIERFLNEKLIDYKNHLKVSLLIVRNLDRKIVVNSAYPFENMNPEIEYSFFPGSIKKGLIASYVCEKERKILDSITPLNNGKSGVVKNDWIRLSDNKATMYVSKKVNTIKFADYLYKEFNLHFYSPVFNGYAEHIPFDFDKLSDKEKMSVIIGGTLKYTPITINEWYQQISHKSRKNRTLFEMMHSPFLRNGTAYTVGLKLMEANVDIDKLICKTGTLEAEKKKLNLCSGFALASEKYTITLLIDGIQPRNSEQKSAKHLFCILINELKPYLE